MMIYEFTMMYIGEYMQEITTSINNAISHIEKGSSQGIQEYIVFISSIPYIEYIVYITACICAFYFMIPRRRSKGIPASIQQRIINRITEQNTSIQTAKLYIHTFTTTIAAYRQNVDYLLENKAKPRGILIAPTVGGKVPIFTLDSFYTLIYCAIAFQTKQKAFESDLTKQKHIIESILGYLPRLECNSSSAYHTYMAFEEYARTTQEKASFSRIC